MWLRMLTLLVLTGAVTLASVRRQNHVEVCLNDQEKSLEVPYGATLTLVCCLNVTTTGRIFIKWYFNRSEYMNIAAKTLGQELRGCPDKGKTCNLTNVNEAQRGWYLCKITIDIPLIIEHVSNPTQILISPPDLHVHWWIWIIVGVSSSILFTFLLICLWKTGKCCRKRATPEPIYANTHNYTPSPKPKMDAHSQKTGSTYQSSRLQRHNRKANTDKCDQK